MEQQNLIIQENNSAEKLIEQAIDKNVPIETMEKLLGMRRELRAEWAKTKFDESMAKFQGECPVIVKTKNGGKTKMGIVAYKYAPLDEIVSKTKSLIQDNGFSYLIKTEMKKDTVKVICIVKHKFGHSEDTSVVMPLSTRTDIMSAPQQTAATITFAKRYAFCNAFGILTGDEDNDGQEIKNKNTQKPSKNEILMKASLAKIEGLKTKSELIRAWEYIKTSNKFTDEEKEQLIVAITKKLEKYGKKENR